MLRIGEGTRLYNYMLYDSKKKGKIDRWISIDTSIINSNEDIVSYSSSRLV